MMFVGCKVLLRDAELCLSRATHCARAAEPLSVATVSNAWTACLPNS